MVKSNFIERVLFARPALYRLKRFVIEVVIWRGILSGICRLQPHPLPDLSSTFASQRVLLAACGPGSEMTGPALDAASHITAFDLSLQFAHSCAASRPTWAVYCGDLLSLPHRDHEFD